MTTFEKFGTAKNKKQYKLQTAERNNRMNLSVMLTQSQNSSALSRLPVTYVGPQ